MQQLMVFIVLVPVVLVASTGINPENANIKIDERSHTLKKVDPIVGKKRSTLDLEELDLEVIDSEAFSNGWDDLKNLSLNNNSLYNLPPNVLKDLPNLEQLELSGNAINSGHFYGNSSPSLHTLMISNNPLATFTPGYFYGLKDTYIDTKDTPIKYISTGAFGNYSSDFQDGVVAETECLEENSTPSVQGDTTKDDTVINIKKSTFKATYCINDQQLVSVKVRKPNDRLLPGCHNILIVDGRLNLRGFDIKNFGPRWYDLHGHDNIKTVILTANKISELSESFVATLPDGIEIILSENMFVKLNPISEPSQVKSKHRIENLNFGSNNLASIGDNAFANFDIFGTLTLSNNKLKDTRFLKTLPFNVTRVYVRYNKLATISGGNFENFSQFYYLDLSHNKIKMAHGNTLRNFGTLKYLDLSHNNLNHIETNFFKGIKNLEELYLNDNKFTEVYSIMFDNLVNIKIINLARNCLTVVQCGPFSRLPSSLLELHLDGNYIETVKKGSFQNGPSEKLYLSYNRISEIRSGSFNISHLEFLDLSFNALNKIDNNIFEGIGKLDILSLEANNITAIGKGLNKEYLNSLVTLDLSHNPISLLEKGDFAGLSKENRARIILNGVPIDGIYSNLFDD